MGSREKKLRDYELTVVVSPEVTDEDFPAAIEKVSQFITQRGGEVNEVNQWGRRKLAYPINHFGEGNYFLTQFKLDPKMVAEVEGGLLLSEEILRHLLVRKDG